MSSHLRVIWKEESLSLREELELPKKVSNLNYAICIIHYKISVFSLESEEAEICDDQRCQKCGKSDQPEWILLCDECDHGYHCSCLKPVLFIIPEGDWYCPPCQQVFNKTSLCLIKLSFIKMYSCIIIWSDKYMYYV